MGYCLCFRTASFPMIPSGCTPIYIPDMDSSCKIKVSFLIYVNSLPEVVRD